MWPWLSRRFGRYRIDAYLNLFVPIRIGGGQRSRLDLAAFRTSERNNGLVGAFPDLDQSMAECGGGKGLSAGTNNVLTKLTVQVVAAHVAML